MSFTFTPVGGFCMHSASSCLLHQPYGTSEVAVRGNPDLLDAFCTACHIDLYAKWLLFVEDSRCKGIRAFILLCRAC